MPLQVGQTRRGTLLICSLRADFFTPEDVRFAEAVARWIAVVAQKAELTQTIAHNALEQGKQMMAEELVTVLAHDLRNLVSPIAVRLDLVRLRATSEGRPNDVRHCEAG